MRAGFRPRHSSFMPLPTWLPQRHGDRQPSLPFDPQWHQVEQERRRDPQIRRAGDHATRRARYAARGIRQDGCKLGIHSRRDAQDFDRARSLSTPPPKSATSVAISPASLRGPGGSPCSSPFSAGAFGGRLVTFGANPPRARGRSRRWLAAQSIASIPTDTENVTGELLARLEAPRMQVRRAGRSMPSCRPTATPIGPSQRPSSPRATVLCAKPTRTSSPGDLLGIVVAEYLRPRRGRGPDQRAERRD